MREWDFNKKLTIYLALVCFLAPGITTIWFPSLSGSSKIEMRNLQDLPAVPSNLTELYSWPRLFDQFVSDRFPFREKIVNTVSKILYPLGISISPDVLVGREGWLFLKKTSDVLIEARGIQNLTKIQVEQWVNNYAARKEILSKKGMSLFLVIIPNKHTIYSQYLPEWHRKVGETITDQLVNKLKSKRIKNVIDLRPVLTQKATEELIYKKYDSHWNDIGAYSAYSALIKKLPGARPISTNQLLFSNKQKSGDLSGLIGNESLIETFKTIQVSNSRVIDEDDWKRKRLFFNHQSWSSKTNIQDGPKALFFCDSFTNARLSNYLKESFPQSIYKHHANLRFDKEEIDKQLPDIVAYIIAERLIPYSLTN